MTNSIIKSKYFLGSLNKKRIFNIKIDGQTQEAR